MIDSVDVIPYGHSSQILKKGDEQPDSGHPMYYEKNRLNSFVGWNVRFIEPVKLAKAGFYFTHKDDRVKCPFCNIEIYQWKQGDDPLRDHKTWSPACRYIRHQPCGNIPMSEDCSPDSAPESDGYDTCGKFGIQLRPNSYPENEGPLQANLDLLKLIQTRPPAHPKYVTYESRLQSFEDWPVAIKQKPAELAEAGFYYFGKGDQVVCFHCNGGLKNWLEEDDPWEQHARWFSKCCYLNTHKSLEYIEKVCNKLPAVLSSEQAEAIVPNKPSTSTEKEDVTNEVEETTKESSNSTNNKATLCKICYEKEIGIVFLPCRHMVACVDCAPSLENCAVCRKPLQATLRAFIS